MMKFDDEPESLDKDGYGAQEQPQSDIEDVIYFTIIGVCILVLAIVTIRTVF